MIGLVEPFDLIFVDPPYAWEKTQNLSLIGSTVQPLERLGSGASFRSKLPLVAVCQTDCRR